MSEITLPRESIIGEQQHECRLAPLWLDIRNCHPRDDNLGLSSVGKIQNHAINRHGLSRVSPQSHSSIGIRSSSDFLRSVRTLPSISLLRPCFNEDICGWRFTFAHERCRWSWRCLAKKPITVARARLWNWHSYFLVRLGNGRTKSRKTPQIA